MLLPNIGHNSTATGFSSVDSQNFSPNFDLSSNSVREGGRGGSFVDPELYDDSGVLQIEEKRYSAVREAKKSDHIAPRRKFVGSPLVKITPRRKETILASTLSPVSTASLTPTPHHAFLTSNEPDAIQTPKTVYEALQSQQKQQWIDAMNREKRCHLKNKTFGQVWDRTVQVKPIPADWIFKVKRGGAQGGDSTIIFKARIVLRGQFMKPGLDFNDAFAPVAKTTTIRAVLAVATKYDLELFGGDVETAFVTPNIDTEIWVTMPPFFGTNDSEIAPDQCQKQVRKLLKGVPGIPGSKLFYEKFSAVITSLGFRTSSADRCLFVKNDTDSQQICVIWVDDFIFACRDKQQWSSFLNQLKKHFTITGGQLENFLGLEIKRNRVKKQLSISQTAMIETFVSRSGMNLANPVPVPCAAGTTFTRSDCPKQEEKQALEEAGRGATPFRQRSATINFFSCWSRPDVTFTINKLSKFMSNPGSMHWSGLNYLIKYLKGSSKKGLLYNFSSNDANINGVHGYTDASYADCPDSARSTIGYAFFYDNALISWYSKLHSFVATSTNHSEYAALAMGAKEAQWLQLLFQDLDPHPARPLLPIPIFGDSSGVISLVFNPIDHQSNKHIRIADHYARELTKEGVIAPHKISSELNRADIFTKPLQGANFKKSATWLVQEKLQDSETICMFHASSIQLNTSIPILLCRTCRITSSPDESWIQCTICEGKQFFWTCNCQHQPDCHQSPSHDLPSFSANGCEASDDWEEVRDRAYMDRVLRERQHFVEHLQQVTPEQRRTILIAEQARLERLQSCEARVEREEKAALQQQQQLEQQEEQQQQQQHQQLQITFNQPQEPPQRSRRRRSEMGHQRVSLRRKTQARSGMMVAYHGKASRRTVFHSAACEFVTSQPEIQWLYCPQAQANGYGMRPAAGCQYHCLEYPGYPSCEGGC
jgi:hypothetical protein